MGHKDRTYMIIESGIGGPPQGNPVLGDKDGTILPHDVLIEFNKTTDGLRKVDHYRVRFEIDDFNDSTLRFTDNESDMMWVKKGSGPGNCPTTPCNDLPDTLWVDKAHPQGKWIEVINMDMRQEEFWFTLNLVRKSDPPNSTNYVPVDPGGGNQNAGGPGSGFTFESNLLAGGMTGAIVGLGAASYAAGGFVPVQALAFAAGGAVVGLIVGFVLDRF